MSARGSRFYDILLRVLPREFRARHGVAMAETFAALHDRARHDGAHHVALLWIRECRDLVRTGVHLRTGGVARRTAGVPGSGRHTSEPHRGPMPVQARRRSRALGNAFDDLRLAARATTRSRSFFLLAAVTLALGIGATTAMYSALRAVVLDPLPFPTSDRLVMLWRTTGGSGAFVALEKEQIEALRAERSIFDGIEGILGGTSTLTGATEPVRVRTLSVTAGVPALMEVRPVIGRVFTPAELAGDGERVRLVRRPLRPLDVPVR